MKADAATESEVVSVLNAFSAAYAARDAGALMACIGSDDDVLLYGTGADEKRVGSAEIEQQAMRDWEQTESVAIVYESTAVSAAGEVAWASADGAFEFRVDGNDMRLPARITFVLENRGGRWLIMQIHCSTPSGAQAEGRSF